MQRVSMQVTHAIGTANSLFYIYLSLTGLKIKSYVNLSAVRNLLLVSSGVWRIKVTFRRRGMDKVRKEEQSPKGHEDGDDSDVDEVEQG